MGACHLLQELAVKVPRGRPVCAQLAPGGEPDIVFLSPQAHAPFSASRFRRKTGFVED
jgi:hypothetical protein